MSRSVLFLVRGDGFTHVMRAVRTAAALAENYGAACVIAGSGRYMRLASEAGFKTEEIPDRAIGAPLEEASAVRSVAAEEEAIRNHAPRVVVSDGRITAAASTATVGVPWANVDTACKSRWFFDGCRDVVRDAMTEAEEEAYRALGPLEHLARLASTRWQQREMPTDIFALRSADLNLFPDDHRFVGLPEHLASDAKFVGPIFPEEAGALRGLEEVRRHRPLVMCTVGSGPGQEAIRPVLEALLAAGAGIVLLGQGWDATADQLRIRSHPSVLWRETAPFWSLLDAVDAVLAHGSESTIYATLAKGVPITALRADTVHQALYASLVARSGAGIGVLSALENEEQAMRVASATIEMALGAEAAGARRWRERLTPCRGATAAAEALAAAYL